MRDFFRPVATLLTGTVLAQVLVYASRPLLTRLFTPEEYGVLSFYAGVVAVVASFSSGKFEDALMLPGDSRQSWSLAAASILMTLVTAVVMVVLLPFRSALEPLVSSPLALEVAMLAPVSVVFIGVARTCDAWLTRNSRFDLVARGRISHSAVTVPSQIGGGAAGWGAYGLVGGLVLGQAAQAIYYARKAVAVSRAAGLIRPTLPSVVATARRYRRFALLGAPGTALNTASVQLPALSLLFFFDADVLGNYGVGYSVLAVPMTLLGSAVAQVYYVRAADAMRSGDLTEITLEVFRRLVALGLFPILSVAIAGPEIFRFVFGESWSDAGLYASYLALWVLLVFVSSPLSRLFDLLEKQRELLLFNIVLLATRGAALLFGGVSGDANLAILLFGAAGALLWLVHTIWMLHLARVPLGTALSAVLRYAGYAIVPAAAVVASKLFGGDFVTTLAVVLSAAGYYLMLIKLEPHLILPESEPDPGQHND
ncbi:MAG: oligosaccharide flippase family protein [Rhodothermia bacterium]|nr:oligosaccharide flippase family protein [Rhodothermia bacterium]